MRGHGHLLRRGLMLPVGAVVLIAGHAYVLSHMALSAAVVAGLVILVVLRHLGLLGPLFTRLRRRWQRVKPGGRFSVIGDQDQGNGKDGEEIE